mgnify:CR=1 FL=1|tara:strand:+ start:2653 stop:2958 length:306 start_codon:yes stop_codon:yes gene_type:complete
MLVKLTELCSSGAVTAGKNYNLREIYINPKHVIMIREETIVKTMNEAGNIKMVTGESLDKNHSFSKLTINRGNSGTEIIVVGSPLAIENVLGEKQHQILNG